MQINGAIKGDFEVKGIRFHAENKLRELIGVLKVKVRQEDGAKVWGDDFMGVAFSGLREGDEPSWAYQELNKPDLVCEVHTVEINGQTLEVQPEIPKIIAVEDEAAVIVPLRMRIDLKTEKIAGKVAFACDATTEIKFDAKQRPVPGTNANAPAAVRTTRGAHGNPTPVRA